MKKGIIIATNDPDASHIKLTVQANIIEILRIKPAYMNFRRVHKGTVIIKEVHLTNTGKKPLKITSIDTRPSQVLSISSPKAQPSGDIMLAPGEARTLMITFRAPDTRGKVYGNIAFHTDLEDLPKKQLRVHALIIPDPAAPGKASN